MSDEFLKRNPAGQHFIDQVRTQLTMLRISPSKVQVIMVVVKVLVVNLMKDCGVE